jgi:hypothetical protein
MTRVSIPGDVPTTADERFAQRLDAWTTAAHLTFVDDATAARYQERCRWIRDAVELRDSVVPVCPGFQHYPIRAAGLTATDATYNFALLGRAYLDFHAEFMPDIVTIEPFLPGAAFDLLDCRQWAWPGHGVGVDGAFQFVEGEYMDADEYELLIDDPTSFWLTRYLPRVFPQLEALGHLPPLGDFDVANVMATIAELASAEARTMAGTIGRACDAAAAWMDGTTAAIDGVTIALGLPALYGATLLAPYDVVADFLRGARATMMDTIRRPDQLRQVLERLAPRLVRQAVRAVDDSGLPFVLIPLHWGSDGFMSEASFRELYWPTLKAVILGCMDAGVVPFIWTEADYTTRLPIIADPDIPSGRVVWAFENTDMRAAKDALGGLQCVAGNLPVSLLAVGSPADVEAAVGELIAAAAPGGGYIFSTGSSIDEARPENVAAMIHSAKALSGRED